MSPSVVAVVAAAAVIAPKPPVRLKFARSVEVGVVDREHVGRGRDALVLYDLHAHRPAFLGALDADHAGWLLAGEVGDLPEP
jgi:hypothetical protein